MALDITTTLHHLTNNTNYHTLQVYSITLNEPTRESFTRKFAVKTCQQNDGYRYIMRLWYAIFICMYTHKYIQLLFLKFLYQNGINFVMATLRKMTKDSCLQRLIYFLPVQNGFLPCVPMVGPSKEPQHSSTCFIQLTDYTIN